MTMRAPRKRSPSWTLSSDASVGMAVSLGGLSVLWAIPSGRSASCCIQTHFNFHHVMPGGRGLGTRRIASYLQECSPHPVEVIR